MKKITSFIYVTTDKYFIQPSSGSIVTDIGTNWTVNEKEDKIIKELDSKVRKLIETYEDKLNR